MPASSLGFHAFAGARVLQPLDSMIRDHRRLLPVLSFLGMISLVFARIVLPAAAQADEREDCSPIRMDYKGGSMEHVHARSQQDLGICFAETGAQVADAIRFSRLGDTRFNFQTSAVDVAAGLSLEKGRNAFKDGGKECWALSYIQKEGVCADAAVEHNPSLGASYASGTAEIEAGILREISGDEGSAAGGAPDRQLVCRWPGEDSQPVPESEFLAPGLQRRLVSDACDAGTIRRLTRSCTTKTRPPTEINPFASQPPLGCDVFPKKSQENSPGAIGRAIDADLEAPAPLPIEIHFCPKMLESGVHLDCRTDGHAALVIGRRWNDTTHSCQYLVRNSWGTECSQYPPRISGHGNCEEGLGNIWLDRGELLASTDDIVRPPRRPPPTAQALAAWKKARSEGFPPAVAPAAPTPDRRIRYRVDGRIVELRQRLGRGLMISEDCFSSRKCVAYAELTKATTAGMDDELVGGVDPGALICKALRGKPAIAVDLVTGNEDGLCLFKGGAYVSTATLFHYALKNDGLLVIEKR